MTSRITRQQSLTCVTFLFLHISDIFYQVIIEMGCTESNNINGPAPVGQSQVMQNQQVPKSSAIPLQNGAEFDTIVIGGGIGGIAAAVELGKAGQNVAIFEANGYIGGRLKTIPVPLTAGGVVQFDQGASWIHGAGKDNPITGLSKYVGGLVMKQTDDGSAEVYDQKGEDAQEAADQAWEIYEKITQKLQDQTSKISMQAAMKGLGAPINDKFFMFHVSNDMEFQTSGSVGRLAGSGNDDDQFQGPQMLVLSGYQRFAQTLLNQAAVQVYVNQKVFKVVWSEEGNEIVCGNGITVYAKNVVIAVPIGVLKNQGIQFVPPLPGWKNQAIQSIGFGNVCKILIDFPDQSFIESEKHYVGVVSDNIAERGLCTYFLNLQAIAGVPAMMTFGLGDNAYQAEQMPENQLKALIARRMSAFSQKQISPNSFKIARTSWAGNQNFFGTYAFASTQTQPKHWQSMAKPVFASNWYFCGEHTSSVYRGTVHGAYLSGVHTAQSITKEVGEEDWEYQDGGESENNSNK